MRFHNDINKAKIGPHICIGYMMDKAIHHMGATPSPGNITHLNTFRY